MINDTSLPRQNIWRWMLSAYLIELKGRLQYRANFWTKTFAVIGIRVAVSYSLWSSIYALRNWEPLGGYSFEGMVFYSVLATLYFQLGYQEIGVVSVDIREGGLTRYLLYPISFHLYKSVAEFARLTLALLQFGIGNLILFFVCGFPVDVELSLHTTLLALAAGALGAYAWFLMVMIVECVAFWAEYVWSLTVAVQFLILIFGGVFVPLSLYPVWAQELFAFLPFQYIVSFPTQMAMGRLTLQQYTSGITMLLLWIGVLLLGVRFIWNRGQREYTGVGI